MKIEAVSSPQIEYMYVHTYIKFTRLVKRRLDAASCFVFGKCVATSRLIILDVFIYKEFKYTNDVDAAEC